MIQTTGLIGLGAMGLLYSQAILKTKGPRDFCVVLDEARLSSYRQRTFRVQGQVLEIPMTTPDAAKAPLDLAIFAVKYRGLNQAMATMAPVIGPQTIIVSLLNGIRSEDDLSRYFDPSQVLLAVAQGMDATFQGDDLRYSRPGLLEIGCQDVGQADRLQAVVDFLRACGIEVVTPANIRHRVWSKFMLNVGVNQVVGVLGGGYGSVQIPGPGRDQMRAAMDEARAVAQAEGVDLTVKDRDDYIAVVDGLSPQGKPSLLQDLEAGRPTEVDLFSGTICALGRQHGIPTPVNDWLYEAICRLGG